jgi:hypothetical protein
MKERTHKSKSFQTSSIRTFHLKSIEQAMDTSSRRISVLMSQLVPDEGSPWLFLVIFLVERNPSRSPKLPAQGWT